ncbi:MAG: T9SS type A sorting domain-containing protein [Ignavibacteriae bacterium]|nr:T9SS type A sorting domain-containing protein [Ignavibacteriota bacterium]
MSEYYCNLYFGTMKYVGLNTFSNEINNCEINANYNCFIKAELNNWGTNPKFNIFNSYFDNLPIWDGFSNNQNITTNDENNFNLICNKNSNLEKALKYQQDGFYNDAILLYQNYIKKNITSPLAANVLTRIKDCFTLSDKSGFGELLKEITELNSEENIDLDIVCTELQNQCSLIEKNYNKVIRNIEYLIEKYDSNLIVKKYSLFNLALIYFVSLGDTSRAKETLRLLELIFPLDELVLDLKYLFGNTEIVNLKNDSFLNSYKDSAVNNLNYCLYQNYPNPFNPKTRIKYSIHNRYNKFYTSNVNLKIYDVIGREIIELVNEKQKGGIYEIEFDATKFSSGVYIIKLSIDDFIDTKKAILLK